MGGGAISKIVGPDRERIIARVWESKLNDLNREYLECINATRKEEKIPAAMEESNSTEGQQENEYTAPVGYAAVGAIPIDSDEEAEDHDVNAVTEAMGYATMDHEEEENEKEEKVLKTTEEKVERLPPASKSEAKEASKSAPEESLTPEKSKRIQEIMGELDLPTPDWARNIPEEVWMTQLKEVLDR
eukprot:1096-Amorphochlora_amoeboformis.AAC.2